VLHFGRQGLQVTAFPINARLSDGVDGAGDDTGYFVVLEEMPAPSFHVFGGLSRIGGDGLGRAVGDQQFLQGDAIEVEQGQHFRPMPAQVGFQPVLVTLILALVQVVFTPRRIEFPPSLV